MRNGGNVLWALAICLGPCAMQAQETSHQYEILRRIHLPESTGWDYLSIESATGRLFVSRGTMVQVADVASGRLLGTIPDTKGVHGIAIASDLGKGFISDGADSSVTVFDLPTLKVTANITVTGRNPDAILYDPYTQRVFTGNGRSSNVTVIDAKSDKVLGTIPLSGKPEFAVTDGNGRIYFNIEDKSMVAEIDPEAMKVGHTWPTAPGEGPSGLAIDTKNHRLFSVCGNKLMVVLNAENGKVVASLPIGGRVDGAAFDPGLMRAYSSNGEGTLTVVQELTAGSFKVVENLPTELGARTITVDPKTHHLYLPTAEFGPAPAPTAENPRPRPTIKPDSFVVLEVAPRK